MFTVKQRKPTWSGKNLKAQGTFEVERNHVHTGPVNPKKR